MGDGSPATTGNVQNITGSGMYTGMEFDYPYKSEADGYVDYFSANGGEILFRSQDDYGRIGCSGYFNDYRTITSAVFFSVLEEVTDATTREDLMTVYMDYLTGTTGVSGGGELSTAVVTAANPAMGSFSAILALQECAHCDIGLFDLTGRKIGSFVSGSLPPGTHNLSISGNSISAGTYFIHGTVGGQEISHRTVLLK